MKRRFSGLTCLLLRIFLKLKTSIFIKTTNKTRQFQKNKNVDSYFNLDQTKLLRVLLSIWHAALSMEVLLKFKVPLQWLCKDVILYFKNKSFYFLSEIHCTHLVSSLKKQKQIDVRDNLDFVVFFHLVSSNLSFSHLYSYIYKLCFSQLHNS